MKSKFLAWEGGEREREREFFLPVADLYIGGFPGGGAPVGLSVG